MVMQSERDLIGKAQGGDQRAFEQLVLLHEAPIRKTVWAMLGDTPEAKDVAQEVFIRWFQSINDFESRSSLRTYLTRIAINLSLNELKRRKQKSKWLVFGRENTPEYPEPNDHEVAFKSWEAGELLHKALSLLAPDFRIVLVLRLIEGYSVQETAAMLQIPEGTVASRLARAQIKLKELIAKLDK